MDISIIAIFIRFLFFVDVACSYHIAMVAMRVIYPGKGGFWVCLNVECKIDQKTG